MNTPDVNVDAFGDSITYGQGCAGATPCDFFTNTFQAINVATTPGVTVTKNYGVTGQVQSASWTRATARIPADKPKFAMWSVWSQNNGVTAAIIQSSFDTYVQAFIDLCHANGTIPIIITSIPSGIISNSTDDNARLSVNTQGLALTADDVIVVNMDTNMTNGASPARIASGKSNDSVHPNATGGSIMTTALQNAVQAWITAHP